MKTQIAILSILTVCFACKPSHKEVVSVEDTSLDTTLVFETKETKELPKDLREECTRGQAEPIIKEEKYPGASFILQADSLTAIESMELKNGDSLIIHNWGCESYVLTFRFETSQFKNDTTELEYWYKSAKQLITGMIGAIDAPIDIKKGVSSLSNYIDRNRKNQFVDIELGEEIDFGGEIIREYLCIDRIQKISDSRYAVEISFVIGPL